LRSILKVNQFAFDLIQIAVNFNVRLSQFKKKEKKKPYMMGLGFPVFSNKTGSNRTGKNKKKTYILRDWVS
jgi:hypothetical protein